MYASKKQGDAAKKAAAATQINPYGVSSPYGTMANNGGVLSFNAADNPFANMFNQTGVAGLANAATAPGSFLNGASEELGNAYRGLTSPDLEVAGNERYNMLTQLAQPEQQRSQNALQDTLFAQGRTGTSGGGIQQEAWQNSANQADLQRQLAGQDWAQTRAGNRFSSALQAVQSGQQGQMNNFNIGRDSSSGLSHIWNGLLNSGAYGINAGGGQAPGAAMAAGAAAGQPYAAAYGALSNSGVFDKIGGLVGGWMGGNKPYQPTATPTGVPVTGGSPTNPYGLDFGPPKGGF
jgi:hypothetical protein